MLAYVVGSQPDGDDSVLAVDTRGNLVAVGMRGRAPQWSGATVVVEKLTARGATVRITAPGIGRAKLKHNEPIFLGDQYAGGAH